MSIIAKLSNLQEQRKRRQLASYDAAVIAAATDSDAEAEDIDAILDAVGKTVAQFQSDIERYHERCRMVQQYEEQPRWQAEAEALQEQMRQVGAAAEEAERRFAEQMQQLNEQRKEASSKSAAGEVAGDFLRRWMPEWLRSEIDPLEKEAIEHRGAVHKYVKRIGELQDGVRRLTARKQTGWEGVANQEDELKWRSEELERWIRYRDERKPQLDAIEGQLARLRALQLKPWPLPSDLEEE